MDLNQLILEDDDAVTSTQINLRTRGYAYVILPDSLVDEITKCRAVLEDFFALDVAEKEKYFHNPIFGWFEVPHKEVYRFKSGSKMNEFTFPPGLEIVRDFGAWLDSIMFRLAAILFPGVAGKLKGKIPFGEWGMIDAVLYNNKTERKRGMNIVEHHDPGLLTLSFLSSARGLELLDEHGEWISVPVDKTLGVLWTGQAAVDYDASYAACEHRVVTADVPRIGMWYEICTYEQERNDLLTGDHYGYAYELELMAKEGFEPVRSSDGKITGYKGAGTTRFGYYALEANTTGTNKIAIGRSILDRSGTSDGYTAIGYRALEVNATESNNVTFGNKKLV